MLLAAFALAAVAANAATPATVELEAMTSPELAARIAAGATIAIVPIGGTEQNGPYMTLGKHNARVVALADRIAARLGNAVVAPVIAYVPEGAVSPPQAHMRYAGTISISERAFESTLEGAAASLRQHGFRDIVFLGDHGGYQASLARVAARLDKAWAGTPARAHAIPEYYRASSSGYAAALAAKGHSRAEIGTHAGLADTSLTLAVAPADVRQDALHAAANPSAAPGVAGDPRHASAALGESGVDAIVASTVEAIRKAVARR
jgi:creatinine amidohydrolase/Fe(II)-dependent formamide hydrolase-like protein